MPNILIFVLVEYEVAPLIIMHTKVDNSKSGSVYPALPYIYMSIFNDSRRVLLIKILQGLKCGMFLLPQQSATSLFRQLVMGG